MSRYYRVLWETGEQGGMGTISSCVGFDNLEENITTSDYRNRLKKYGYFSFTDTAYVYDLEHNTQDTVFLPILGRVSQNIENFMIKKKLSKFIEE